MFPSNNSSKLHSHQEHRDMWNTGMSQNSFKMLLQMEASNWVMSFLSNGIWGKYGHPSRDRNPYLCIYIYTYYIDIFIHIYI